MNLGVAEPARLGECQIRSGQVLGWAEWGPPEGIPVLLCPGAGTSRWLGFGTHVVDRIGVRLISVDRTGLGISTPMPGRTFADTVDALARFAAARELGRPAMVGNSQGAPFVLACATAGIAGTVAIVSGADEVAAPCFAQHLPVDLRALVDRVATDPAGAETMFARWNPEAMWQMVTMSSPVSDLQIYQDPVFEDTYRRALVEGFARGSAGYARDTVLAMSRWLFDLSQITVRVDLWYGAEDTAHSPDNGATLARRIPTAHHHLVDGIGGAVLWTHAEPILHTLLAVR